MISIDYPRKPLHLINPIAVTMNFGGASPSGLRPPVSSASPSGSNNTTTGRPQLWTPSSQRKVSRLYLYTTLSLEKIMAVVHAKSPDPVPGCVCLPLPLCDLVLNETS